MENLDGSGVEGFIFYQHMRMALSGCSGSFSLQELLAKGNQWTKEMEMRLTDTDVVLLDGETQVKMQITITCFDM